ncbi:phospho-sugar mutase [Clostridium sp. CTA-19]
MKNDYKRRYDSWMSCEVIDELSKKELINIDEDEIEDRFHKDLEFGTGGLRGIMGSGTNRLNKYTVSKATEGFSKYLIKKYKDPISVVIAYDSRNSSKEFARFAANVLASNGIKAYMFKELTPTPILSFAVRELKCNGGIVITASHNPKEYNGYKVYDDKGVQVTDNIAKNILKEISIVEGFKNIKGLCKTELEKEYLIEHIGDEFILKYLNKVKSILIRKDIIKKYGTNLNIVYTPLHGTGRKPIMLLMKDLNYTFQIVKEQEEPDGNFPTVPYPNPEQPEVFQLGIEIAKEKNADIILATDPDCDRIGVMAKDFTGDYKILTGNEVGVLLSYYILSSLTEKDKLLKNSIIVKTIVSTDMVKKFKNDFQFDVLEVLTGFKYIGELIEENKDKNFLLGFEESYGYLMGDFVRDKDAVIALSIICEMTLYYKLKGLTLHQQLKSIYEKYGYNKEKLLSFEFKGIKGKEKIESIIKNFKDEFYYIVKENNMEVKMLENYESGKREVIEDKTCEKLNLPKAKVLKFILKDGSWIVVRPSGTEPKIKFYLSTTGASEKDCIDKINELEKIINKIIN